MYTVDKYFLHHFAINVGVIGVATRAANLNLNQCSH